MATKLAYYFFLLVAILHTKNQVPSPNSLGDIIVFAKTLLPWQPMVRSQNGFAHCLPWVKLHKYANFQKPALYGFQDYPRTDTKRAQKC